MTIQQKIGNRFRELRKEKGITQEKLAWKTGYYKSYLSSIECGKVNVSITVLYDFICALDVKVEEFFATKDFRIRTFSQ